MLEYAKKYEVKLKELFFDIAFDPFYRFEAYMCYRDVFSLPENTYNSHHFVSVHNNDILGMISYEIKRPENSVWGLHIIHFGGPNASCPYIFGKDVMTAVKDIFEKYHFNKLNFSVVIGNPVEKTYDKLVKRYNGRVVGTKEQETRLMDGCLYDVKEYEILAGGCFNGKRKLARTQGVQ
ncbi:MAG: hypothetical protein LBP76_09530 [Treponema sp.]|jgi:hypothetical protein|nr:hypothetical protein [Treponema sp.]